MPDTESESRVPAPARVRAGLLAVAGIGAAAGLGVALVSGGPAVLRTIAGLPLATVVTVLVLDVASWIGEAVCFRSLARGTGAEGLRPHVAGGILQMVDAYVGGGFPALVTPFGSGGIPGWIYALAGEGLSAGAAAAVVGTRALLTSVFFVMTGAVIAAVLPARAYGSPATTAAGIGALLVVLCAITVIVARPRLVVRPLERLLRGVLVSRLVGKERATRLELAVSRETERFAQGVRALFRERPLAVAAAAGGLVFSRACLLAIMPVILGGLGWKGDPLLVVGIVIAVQALASGSPTPGGSGTVEAALAAALATAAPAAVAGTAALLWRGTTFYFDLLVGWVLFARRVARGSRGTS